MGYRWKEMTVKTLILEYLRGRDWVWGGVIEDYVRSHVGSKASMASRRTRELQNEGKLEARYEQVNGKGPHVVQYRYREPLTGLRPEVIRERLQGKLI
jgi:hypothetical protein